MKDFKKLIVWQKSMATIKLCYQLVEKFPIEERFGLSSQITRSAISIASNIAEGSGRRTSKDYSRFLQISLGSAFELETQILIAKEFKNANLKLITEILESIDEVQKMLVGLINKVNG